MLFLAHYLKKNKKKHLPKMKQLLLVNFIQYFFLKNFFPFFVWTFLCMSFLNLFLFIYIHFLISTYFKKKCFFHLFPVYLALFSCLVFVVSHVWIFLQSFLHSMHFSFNSLFFVFWFCFDIGVNLFLSDLKLNGICFVFHSLWDL